MYCPLQGRGIGVLVADNPFGPFTDPIGKPLIGGNHDSIDPAVFIDKDGQAYLCWGNPRYWYVKLNKDMISFDTSIGDKGLVVHDMTVEAFGKRSKDDPQRLTTYEEGPWLYQRNALYYLIFAGGPISEHIGYSTGPSPTGPWKYGGVVLPAQGRSFTDHPGIVDYKGKTYLFYHNGDLPGGDGFHRSVCVDEMKFNPDGSIVQMAMTKEGVAPVATLNPYQRVEAETIAWGLGVKTTNSANAGVFVTGIHDGSYIKVCKVDFTGQEPIGKCPKCQNRVFETAMSYVCEKATGAKRTCSFRVGKIILQQPVSGHRCKSSWRPARPTCCRDSSRRKGGLSKHSSW